MLRVDGSSEEFQTGFCPFFPLFRSFLSCSGPIFALQAQLPRAIWIGCAITAFADAKGRSLAALGGNYAEVSVFEIIAVLVSLAAIFGYLNHRFIRLPTIIGWMQISLVPFPLFILGACRAGI